MVTDPLLSDLLSVSFVLMNPGLDLNTIIFNHKVQVVPKSLKILLQFVDARNTKKIYLTISVGVQSISGLCTVHSVSVSAAVSCL